MSLIKKLREWDPKLSPVAHLYTLFQKSYKYLLPLHIVFEQICFDLNGSKIKCEEHVKLLGVTIDYELNFDKHISGICKKSARQLIVLKRIAYCPVTCHFCCFYRWYISCVFVSKGIIMFFNIY
jgi:hypothetical protein